MIAVPKEAYQPGQDRLTGLSCPDCTGTLVARADPKGRLVFECRIGHLYDTTELIEDKEQRAEDLLWGAVAALEELSAFLRDVGGDGVRAARAAEEALALRALLDGSSRARIEGP